jgi:TRAP-type mannitol/chloroaromatic compound transport system permease small subunit
LLKLSRAIDGLSGLVGRSVRWLVLLVALVSAANALVRYALDTSSNGWLELQWYLFSAIFLLCAGYTLMRNEHVRIDIIAGRLSRKAQLWIDIIGGVFFLLPMSVLILVLSWPMFVQSFAEHEMSSNAGGLLRWPAKLLIPAGFLLLILQGVSEIIKRFGRLRGLIPDPAPPGDDPTPEEKAGV